LPIALHQLSLTGISRLLLIDGFSVYPSGVVLHGLQGGQSLVVVVGIVGDLIFESTYLFLEVVEVAVVAETV
jgi:hypothetical protein